MLVFLSHFDDTSTIGPGSKYRRTLLTGKPLFFTVLGIRASFGAFIAAWAGRDLTAQKLKTYRTAMGYPAVSVAAALLLQDVPEVV